MPVPSRNTQQGEIVAGQRTFFVTSSTHARQALFEQESAARLFVAVLYDYRRQGKYLLHEFVVMPDHFHALLTVDSTLSIERAVQFIKGGFAFRAGKELGLKPPLWQKGFSEARIWDRDSYFGRKDYVRNNPVRAGLAFPGGVSMLFRSRRIRTRSGALAPQRLKPYPSDPHFPTPKGVG